VLGTTNRAVGAARDPEGRIVSCEWATGRVTRGEADGRETVLARAYRGLRLNRPDDVVVRADGTVYFTDVPDAATDHREPFAIAAGEGVLHAGVYRVGADPDAPELLVDDLSEPGGLALSPDERTLYVSDPRGGEVRAYDLGDDGSLVRGSRRRFAAIAGDGRAGAPFGMTVDLAGNVYCGGPGGIWVLDPSGTHLGTIAHPASRTTNLAWGGADGRTLFFTTYVAVGYVEMRARGIVPAPVTDAHAVTSRGPVLRVERRVERLDPALDRIVAPGAEVVELASGGVSDDLGGGPSHRYARSLEGPVWVPAGGYLLFSDIGNDRQLRWTPGEGLSPGYAPTGNTNGATLDPAGRVVSCEHSGRRVSRREPDGTVSAVAERFEGKRFGRPNDVVVRSDGTVYFTAPWWDFGAGETREIDFNGVFRVTPDLATVSVVARDFLLPNGLCLSADEQTLYVDDTRRSHIRAFDVLPDGDVDPASDRIFAELVGDGPGRPDGMKVDVEGNVYCGGPGGIWILAPDGTHLGTVVHGATQTNNLAFGGPDLTTLYYVSWVSLGCVEVLVPGAPVPRAPADPRYG
jgi:gluconolactonase